MLVTLIPLYKKERKKLKVICGQVPAVVDPYGSRLQTLSRLLKKESEKT